MKHEFPYQHVHLPTITIVELDKLQGGKTKDKATHHHDYTRLDKLFKHPYLKDILKENLQRHAEGGKVHFENLAKEGRHGDTKLALIPKSLMHHLDDNFGKHTINPHTGFPEYFLSTLADAASKLMPAVHKGVTSLMGARHKYKYEG